MRASDFQQLQRRETVQLIDWCLDGSVPKVECFFNEATGVAYQVWLEAGRYRHTDPLNGQPRPYGEWKQLTHE